MIDTKLIHIFGVMVLINAVGLFPYPIIILMTTVMGLFWLIESVNNHE